jgi:hypothetical protein
MSELGHTRQLQSPRRRSGVLPIAAIPAYVAIRRDGPGADVSDTAISRAGLSTVPRPHSEASQSEGSISTFALSPLGWSHMHLRGKDTSKMRGVIEATGKGNFGD